MSPDLLNSSFFIAAGAFATFGAILMFSGIAALMRARPLRFVVRTFAALFMLALGVLAATIAVGIQGYRSLIHEDLAARIWVRPVGTQRFAATFRFADGREATYELAGDEIYVDAHILKWQPIANVLGLHTGYELARVAGRYRAIAQERSGVRTVYSLGQDRPVDLFELRQRYAWLVLLLDAEYGSASFVPVARPAELELRVSNTGLLIREAKAAPKT